MKACDRCLRRSWLVARLAGHLELIRGDRPAVRGVLALSNRRLLAALGGAEQQPIAKQLDQLDIAEQRRRWSAAGATSVCRHDPSYPAGLLELPDPPAALHICGAPERIDQLLAGQAAVAIVGSRRASVDGLALAAELGRQLSLCAVTVVSGMALGIDGAAHGGALAAGDRTVAVLACGPERPYPARRRRLHTELCQRALVLSELPPGTAPWRWAFPARNRIIAALARMTVVVEAAERSGSLITAEIAADLGRSVGAVPGWPAAWHSGGANALLRDGAHIIRDARDVLDDAFGAGVSGVPKLAPRPVPQLTGPQRAVLTAVTDGYSTAASITERCGEPGAAMAALSELELLALLKRRADGSYCLR